MSKDRTEISEKFKSLLPYFLLAAAIIVFYRISGEVEFFVGFLRTSLNVISPFFYGFILAYIVNIPIGSMQRLMAKSKYGFVIKRQRMLSALSVLAILLVIIALILNLIIPAIVDSISFFVVNAHIYWESIMRTVDEFNNMDLFGWHINAEFVMGILGEVFTDFSLENLLQPISAIMSAGMVAFNALIAFISSIYILVEKDKFRKYLHRLLRIFTSEGVNNAVVEILRKLNLNFRQYIRTQTVDGVILGTLATLLLTILGSPYALILGIMLGVVNYIPYFGSIFGSLVAVVVVTLTQGITIGAISAVTLLVIQQIDANVIQPRLMSGSFSLSPLLVIISITVGGAIAGIMGMFVAIPFVAVLKDIFDSVVEYYEVKKFGAAGKNR